MQPCNESQTWAGTVYFVSTLSDAIVGQSVSHPRISEGDDDDDDDNCSNREAIFSLVRDLERNTFIRGKLSRIICLYSLRRPDLHRPWNGIGRLVGGSQQEITTTLAHSKHRQRQQNLREFFY